METRQTDPIIAELRAIRQAYAARAGGYAGGGGPMSKQPRTWRLCSAGSSGPPRPSGAEPGLPRRPPALL